MKRSKTPAGRPESARPDPELDEFDLDTDPSAGSDASGTLRLNKFLAQNGIASRRGADEMIAGGQVTVDGKIVTELGARVDPRTQKVEAAGVILRPDGDRPVYYLLNKPTGVVCTNDPRETRPRAIDLIADRRKGRIYTVGRLDEDTEGLVILTNDGEFTNRISHPRYGVKKTYWVDVRGRVSEEALEKMRAGVRLAEGWGSFEHVKILKRNDERSVVVVTLSEGKNREVRRVFAKLDLPVRTLRRVSIGGLSDRRLKVGRWRPLTLTEVGELLAETRRPATRGDGSPAKSGARPRGKSGGSATVARRPWSKQRPQRGDKGREGWRERSGGGRDHRRRTPGSAARPVRSRQRSQRP